MSPASFSHSLGNAGASTNGDAEPQLTLTQLAARRLERIRATDLAPDVEEKATLCLIDYLGALVSGLSAPWSAALLKYAQTASSSHQNAFVVGSSSSVSAEVAAFTNAAIAHSIIRDDMHLSCGAHIGVMVIPAALALAQRDGWTGQQLLKAIVGGYEMADVLGSAVRQAGTCNPHFRPSGIIGAFAAAGTGIVADGDISLDVAANALGLAANAASGLNEWAWAGGTEINIQMGTASRGGIASLELAKAGISSSETALEGKDGLFAAYRGDKTTGDSAKFFKSWLASKPLGTGIMGAKFKPVAGCNFIQTPISAALSLSQKVVDQHSKIDTISIVTTTAAKIYPGCDSAGPFTKVQQTKMSLQYGVATALLLGKIDEPAYCQYDNAELHTLVAKCVLTTDPSYDEALGRGKQPSRVEIRMQDGTMYREELQDVPWLQDTAVEARFRQEVSAIFRPTTVHHLLEECHRIKHGGPCARLFQLLAMQKV